MVIFKIGCPVKRHTERMKWASDRGDNSWTMHYAPPPPIYASSLLRSLIAVGYNPRLKSGLLLEIVLFSFMGNDLKPQAVN